MSEPFVYTQAGVTSNCCGAPVYDDSDICTDCKEHCGLVITCPDCEGEGEREVLDQSKIHIRTVTPPYKTVECENCNGEGEVEL